MASITETHAIAVQHQQAGRLEIAEQHCQQILAADASHVDTWRLLGAVHTAQGKLDDAIESYQAAIKLTPNDWTAQNSLGNALWLRGLPGEALKAYHRAVQLKPDYVEAISNLGNALQSHGRLNEAVACCRQALALNPDYGMAHNNLGNALQSLGRLEESAEAYRRALELNPTYADAYSNLGNALQQLGRFDEALECYAKAIELDAGCAHAHFCRSTLQLLHGDFENGWPGYEWRLRTNKYLKTQFTQPRWDGTPLANRTILLHAEGGLGDTIQFARFATLVKKQNPPATVIVQYHGAMASLLATCPRIDHLVLEGSELPSFDLQAPLQSLPCILKTTLETIPAEVPYLVADQELVDQWRSTLAPRQGFRIGINWRGRATHRHRDIPLEYFRALADRPEVVLISLQKGYARGELTTGSASDSRIVDLGQDFDTDRGAFMDTAAIMMNLDLIISSDTSIVHVAGALGLPVWMALPYVPDWRWLLHRADSPWYPTMRVFRQQRPGDWSSVFREVATALTTAIGS